MVSKNFKIPQQAAGYDTHSSNQKQKKRNAAAYNGRRWLRPTCIKRYQLYKFSCRGRLTWFGGWLRPTWSKGLLGSKPFWVRLPAAAHNILILNILINLKNR